MHNRGSESTGPGRAAGPCSASHARAALLLGALGLALGACRTAEEPAHSGQAIVATAEAHARPKPLERVLRRWRELAPDPPARLEEAERALSAGEAEQALALLDQAQAEEPAKVLWLLARGELLIALGFPRPAMTDFERAIEVAPADPRAWSTLGRTRLALGLDTRASRALERAIELGLDDAEHHVLLARAYRGCDRQSDASAEYLAALRCARTWESGGLWIAFIGLAGARPGDVLPVNVFVHPLGFVGATLAFSPASRAASLDTDPLPGLEHALRQRPR